MEYDRCSNGGAGGEIPILTKLFIQEEIISEY
jgi:hypothetical protein